MTLWRGCLLSLALTLYCQTIQASECSAQDFQGCKTCDELENAIDYRQPDAGDYYRGAQWNGLFASYVNNCPLIAGRLIHEGANPASGGPQGSMILAVASKWPHDDEEINTVFAAILLASGIDEKTKVDAPQNYSTKKTLKKNSWIEVDYDSILNLFDR